MGDIEGIEELECRMRYRLIFVMGILVITCTVVDAGFFIYYLAGDMLDTPVPVYIIKRLLIPFVVSVASYIAARIYNRSDNSVERKNRICAIALATIAGIMAMCHSYFTPIWCAPAAAMIVGMTFHNKRLGRGLLFYGIGFIVAAACWVMTEHPEEMHYYMQTLFVVLVMHGLFYCVGVVVQGHNLRVVECTRQMALTGQQYREQLQYDALTGVFSRRHLMERALEHMSRCGADDPVSVAIIDIDNFKSVNDTYGHENGDVVLRRLGMLLQRYISENLTIGRFGGEEFVLIFEGTDPAKNEETLEGIRTAFSEEKYDFMDRMTTFSAGLITCTDKGDFDAVLELADRGLYESKKTGKNRITIIKRPYQL